MRAPARPLYQERIFYILLRSIHRTKLHTFFRTAAPFALVALGSFVLSFGLYNVHGRHDITEGGILGLTLLLRHWFGFSPAFTSPLLDGVCFLVGFRFLGKGFAKYSVFASLCYALFYRLWELTGPLLPANLGGPVMVALIGALFVGAGVGLCVRAGAAAGGDDALALVLSKTLRAPISACYLATDLSVLALSLTYIPLQRIVYSLITVTVSSLLIQFVQNAGKRRKSGKPAKSIGTEAVSCSLTDARQSNS